MKSTGRVQITRESDNQGTSDPRSGVSANLPDTPLLATRDDDETKELGNQGTSGQ